MNKNAGMQGLKYVFDAVKVAVAGETPTTNDAQHAKVRL